MFSVSICCGEGWKKTCIRRIFSPGGHQGHSLSSWDISSRVRTRHDTLVVFRVFPQVFIFCSLAADRAGRLTDRQMDGCDIYKIYSVVCHVLLCSPPPKKKPWYRNRPFAASCKMQGKDFDTPRAYTANCVPSGRRSVFRCYAVENKWKQSVRSQRNKMQMMVWRFYFCKRRRSNQIVASVERDTQEPLVVLFLSPRLGNSKILQPRVGVVCATGCGQNHSTVQKVNLMLRNSSWIKGQRWGWCCDRYVLQITATWPRHSDASPEISTLKLNPSQGEYLRNKVILAPQNRLASFSFFFFFSCNRTLEAAWGNHKRLRALI